LGWKWPTGVVSFSFAAAGELFLKRTKTRDCARASSVNGEAVPYGLKPS
jgi:hypothetical protein